MITNYIPRRLLEKESYSLYGEYALYMAETFELCSLIYKKTKKIVLLGDAGYGKSMELRFLTEKFIDEKNPDFIPIYVELNTYTDQDLKDYIRIKLGNDSKEILDYPEKEKLLFLFDEFDQALDKVKATRNLKNFMEEYSESAFVIACRSNFYSGQFSDNSKIVILPSLKFQEVKVYCKNKLGADSDAFIKEINEKNLLEIILNPFFLNHLIDIYFSDKIIPISKGDIFSRIISLSLEKDEKRLSGKYDLTNCPITKTRGNLSYLALIMEILQRNYITIDELNDIFPDIQHVKIITELSLIKKNISQQGDVFQFQHNNFQEFLAAGRIAKLRFKTILGFILALSRIKKSWVTKVAPIIKFTDFSIFGIKMGELLGNLLGFYEYLKINKINPSWINTVAFLCLLREQDDLLCYLMKYEPELTLKFEKNRLECHIREKIFKNIFSKYTDRRTWLDRNRIDFDELSNFVDPNKVYDYLLHYVRSRDHFIHRGNAIEILGRMNELSQQHKDELAEILVTYALDGNENLNVRHESLYALARLGFSIPAIIDKLTSLINKEDMVVSGLLYLIQSGDYVDKYIDIVLAAMVENERSSLVDIIINSERFIQKISSVEAIKKLINFYTQHANDYLLFKGDDLFDDIVDKIILAYERDVSIYDDMKSLLVTFDYNFLFKPISQLRQFFIKTNTSQRLFNELYAEGKRNGRYEYSLLVQFLDEQLIGFLIKENTEGRLSDQNMRAFINYLYSRNAKEAEKYIKIINEKTAKFIQDDSKSYDRIKEEETKRTIVIIFNREEFLLELRKIFSGEGLIEIDHQVFHKILERSFYEEGKYNSFVIREVVNMLREEPDKKFNLAQLEEKINNSNYDNFTISHVYTLLNNDRENKIILSEDQENKIKEFCLRHLNEVNFNTVLIPNERGFSTHRLAIFLWYFLRKYNLEYPENILLDMLSFDWIEGHKYVGIEYLETKLPYQKIKDQILNNLSRNIAIFQVLQNHISFCKRHNVAEVADRLYEIASNADFDEDTRIMSIEAIASFQDYDNLLEDLLDSNNFRVFKKTAEILLKKGNKQCRNKLIKLIKSSNMPSFSLESAVMLIEYQNLNAIRFYAKHIMKTKKFEGSFREKSPIEKITEIQALPILFELLEFCYKFKGEIQQDQFQTLDLSIINALKNIAIQSLKNYITVVKGLRRFIKKYDSKFEGVNFLNAVCDDIERTVFVNFSVSMNIDSAIEKSKSLLN